MDILTRLVAMAALAFALAPAVYGFVHGPWRAEPDWARTPEPADMVRYYPEFARNLGIEGRAVLSCGTIASGEVRDCSVVETTPTGLGFEDATLHLAPLFRMREGKAAKATNEKVRIPIRFALPPPPPAQPLPPPTSEAALKTAREMVAIDGFTRLRLRERLEGTASMMETIEFGGEDPDVRRDAMKAFRDATADAEPALLESYAKIYAGFETEDELRAEIAFRRSAGGKAYVAAGPAMRLAIRQASETMQEIVHLRARCELGACEAVEAQRLAAVRRMRAAESAPADQIATARRVAEAECGDQLTAFAERMARIERVSPSAAQKMKGVTAQERDAAIESMARFYARTFTPDELAAIAALKAGPAGASIRAKGEKLYRAFGDVDARNRELILADARDRFCADRRCVTRE